MIAFYDATSDQVGKLVSDLIRFEAAQFCRTSSQDLSDRGTLALQLFQMLNEPVFKRMLFLNRVDLRIELMQVPAQDLCNLLCDGPHRERNAIVVLKTTNESSNAQSLIGEANIGAVQVLCTTLGDDLSQCQAILVKGLVGILVHLHRCFWQCSSFELRAACCSTMFILHGSDGAFKHAESFMPRPQRLR